MKNLPIKITVCYIIGTVVEKLGREGGLHSSDDTPIGGIVQYPATDCFTRPEDGKVLIPSFDEYGSSAIVLDNIQVIYKEEEIDPYLHWKSHFRS